MSKQLRRCLVVCALLTALTMCVVVAGGMYVLSCNQMEQRLERQAANLAALLEQSEDPVALLEGSVYDQRVTLIGAGGRVLYDSDHAAAAMENHLQRPEVVQARAEGSGSSRRQSQKDGIPIEKPFSDDKRNSCHAANLRSAAPLQSR